MKPRSKAWVWCVLLTGLARAEDKVDFARDVQPIFRARCVECHGDAAQLSGLRLDRRQDALRVIRAGSSASSRLYTLVSTGIAKEGKTLRMPPGGQLSANEVDLIRRWIDEGAGWPAGADSQAKGKTRPRPWSFERIQQHQAPVVRNASWVRNPIDAFVLAKLESNALEPSPEALKTTLMRRLYLDLVGLLPTPQETAAFLADGQPDAYERLVDRLMQSEHYGEKWARPWLDVARFADSEGGVQDYVRPYAWRYREWVIKALNRDMPFDEFTIDQMAGDLVPNATLEQKLATGFHRNTVTSREGGIDLEQLRYDQLVDRANTVGTAWLGLTVGCAQCHDHKYDPITQKDYYRLMAFFDNSDELDIEAPVPGEMGPYRQYVGEYRRERRKLLEQPGVEPLQTEWEGNLRDAAAHPGKRTDWDNYYDSFSKHVDNGLKILHKPLAQRTEREREALTNFFVRYAEGPLGKKRYDELGLKGVNERLTSLAEKYPPLSVVMTLAEAANRHPSHIRLRGNYKDLGAEVTPGTPESLAQLPVDRPPDRLALARWLVSPENPLTARVAMNRSWQELFGRGLARTQEDFGMQGEKPTHPELLDWLASQFVRSGWSMKSMHRLIVTSSTYRQSSRMRPELVARDPGNTLLARQSRMRLPAELIRDAALGASGLLQDSVGGESIRPPQPEGVTDLSYSLKWVETMGRNRYRRGLYVQTQRTALYPLLGNFDVPDRTVSCARREVSNTPLQALNLMNDPLFTEAAQALAARVLKEPASESERIDRVFQLCDTRPASPKERDMAASFLDQRRRLARGNPRSVEPMPVTELDGVEPAEAAAWFGLARALLNSDEFITRE